MLQSSAHTKIRLTPDHIHRGNLILVNSNLPLMTSRRPRLVPMAGLKQSQEETVFLDITAACLLQSILQEIHADGSIVPVSGYRNFSHQRQIYENSLKDSGVDFTMKYVALPGCSEHQTGLAVDLGLRKDHVDYICPDFPYDGICQRFRQRAPEYGFIERYKSEKTSITGIAAEPWHFRYVGYPHSAIMAERGLSLEEYIEFLRQYPYQEHHLQICLPERCLPENPQNSQDLQSPENLQNPQDLHPQGLQNPQGLHPQDLQNPQNMQNLHPQLPGKACGRSSALSGSPIRFEIFFVAMDKLETWKGRGSTLPGTGNTGITATGCISSDAAGLSIALPADKIYQISGNNDDGCIITLWN